LTKTPASRRPSRPAPLPAKKARTATPQTPPKRRFPIALVVGGVLAIALAAVIVVTMSKGKDDAPLEVGTPRITGEALARFESPETDTALGLPIPEVSGADFDGTPVSITRDGRAKMIVFMAHWCSVCQQEVPIIMDWLPGATIPEGVDLYSVSTGVDRSRPNYPPSEWLDGEGWTVPLIMDDAASSVAAAYGLSAYPYFVFVSADGTVVGRTTGGMPAETIASLLAQLGEA
jgi:hypothetical protein